MVCTEVNTRLVHTTLSVQRDGVTPLWSCYVCLHIKWHRVHSYPTLVCTISWLYKHCCSSSILVRWHYCVFCVHSPLLVLFCRCVPHNIHVHTCCVQEHSKYHVLLYCCTASVPAWSVFVHEYSYREYNVTTTANRRSGMTQLQQYSGAAVVCTPYLPSFYRRYHRRIPGMYSSTINLAILRPALILYNSI